MKPISLFLALHLFLVSFLPNNNVLELRKMGNLWKHFEHHLYIHQEDISFVDFVLLHTFDEKHLQQDHEEHEDLPFHQHENSQIIKIFFSLPTVLHLDFQAVSYVQSLQYVDLYAFVLPSNTLAIWQPPKV
jgi:hypothetical protein